MTIPLWGKGQCGEHYPGRMTYRMQGIASGWDVLPRVHMSKVGVKLDFIPSGPRKEEDR